MFKEYGELSTKLYEITKPVGYSMSGDITKGVIVSWRPKQND